MQTLFHIERKPKTVFQELRANGRWWFNRAVLGRSVRRRTFIVGCGHSGTSLLLSILGSHSKIHIFPFETTLFRARSGKIRSVLRHFDNVALSHAKNHWVEKTPRHILYLDKLFTFCPDASVVLMIRDGRDVAMSLKARTQNFEEGVRRWVEDNRAGQAFWNHPRVMTARYEDIIEDFRGSISKIVTFIGETYEEQLERFHETPVSLFANKLDEKTRDARPDTAYGKHHEQYRNWQVNQKLFDGRGRWRNGMSEQEKERFKAMAGGMLVEYGYAASNDW